MLAGIQNGLAGLQANDLSMDVLGSRLSSESTVPFPQISDPTSSSAPTPFLPISSDDDGRKAVTTAGERTSFSQLPGLLPQGVTASLGGDLAGDMGLYLVAQAAYRINARVVSAASHELGVLTQLGQ